MVNSGNFDYFMRFTTEAFVDELEDERKKDEAMLSGLERTHFTLLFLFDLLQFAFQFLTLSERDRLDKSASIDARKIHNPNAPLSFEEDFQHPVRLSFYLADFDRLIRRVCDSIEQLVPNHRLLMRFWQEKNAETPGKSSLLRFDDTRDSYDRCDYYNTYGLAVFFMLKLRRAFF